MSIYKWSVYCITEASYQFVWTDSINDEPTECPNDPAHEINPVLTSLVESPNTDTYSIHNNISNEIAPIPSKTTPSVNDVLLIEDYGDDYSKKKISLNSFVQTDQAIIQIRESNDVDLDSNQYTDVTFDTTDIESDTGVIEHDNTNTDRILIKGSGVYVVSYSCVCNLASSNDTVNIKVRKNDGLDLAGSEINVSAGSGEKNISRSFVAELNNTDYISLQAFSNASGNTLESLILVVRKDSAINASENITAPSSVVDESIVLFDSTSGGALKDSSGVDEKIEPLTVDSLLITDSEDSDKTKRVELGNLPYYSAANEVHDIITVTTPNQVSFTLSNTPVGATKVRMYPQGIIEQINTIDFTVSSNVVSFIAATPSFDVGEKILFKYFK